MDYSLHLSFSQLCRVYLAKTPVGTSRRSSTDGGSDIDTDRFADENDENPGDADSNHRTVGR